MVAQHQFGGVGGKVDLLLQVALVVLSYIVRKEGQRHDQRRRRQCRNRVSDRLCNCDRHGRRFWKLQLYRIG